MQDYSTRVFQEVGTSWRESLGVQSNELVCFSFVKYPKWHALIYIYIHINRIEIITIKKLLVQKLKVNLLVYAFVSDRNNSAPELCNELDVELVKIVKKNVFFEVTTYTNTLITVLLITFHKFDIKTVNMFPTIKASSGECKLLYYVTSTIT